MKLTEVHNAESSSFEFVINKIDFIYPPEPDMFYEEFDVLVEYETEDMGSSSHPYGEGNVEEHHGVAVNFIDAVSLHPIELKNDTDGTVHHVFPLGTSVFDLPGWEESHRDYFQNECEEHVGND